MRTTVTLDPDVDTLLRKCMRERGLSFKEALNYAVRAALSQARAAGAQGFQQQTFAMGVQPEVPLDKALSLASAMEDEETIRELNLRK